MKPLHLVTGYCKLFYSKCMSSLTLVFEWVSLAIESNFLRAMLSKLLWSAPWEALAPICILLLSNDSTDDVAAVAAVDDVGDDGAVSNVDDVGDCGAVISTASSAAVWFEVSVLCSTNCHQ